MLATESEGKGKQKIVMTNGVALDIEAEAVAPILVHFVASARSRSNSIGLIVPPNSSRTIRSISR